MNGWDVPGGAGLRCRAAVSIIRPGSASRARVTAAYKAGTGPVPRVEGTQACGLWFCALSQVLQKDRLPRSCGTVCTFSSRE